MAYDPATSPMDRFYLPPDDWNEESFRLTGDQAHHCVRVMRKSAGDPIELFDGTGRWAHGVVEQAAEGAVTGRIGEAGHSPPLRPQLVLCVAIPKGKTMDLIVQKAVELGVAAIQPLVTEHTVVRLASREREKKRRKWQRVALEACKQCGQNHLPEVRVALDFDDWIASGQAESLCFIASLAPGAGDFREVLASTSGRPDRVAMLIGPEGDFSREETAAALAAGFRPVTLGSIVLRVETAALFCLSVLRFNWPEH